MPTGGILDDVCPQTNNCIYNSDTSNNKLNIKQFMLGTGNEDTFIYKDGSFHTFNQIIVHINGTDTNKWGGNTSESGIPPTFTYTNILFHTTTDI